MAYVITDLCVGVKDGACVDICPVDCIHPTPREEGHAKAAQLYINPEDCIHCGMCVDVCPPRAIFPDDEMPAGKEKYVQINADWFKPRPLNRVSSRVLSPATEFRTPLPPAPIEPVDLAHPSLPPALDGLTILHISDLHVRRNLLRTDLYRQILDSLSRTPADLVLLTGDYMDEPGCEPSHERAALETLAALAGAWHARLGAFAIFGNHDTPEFRRAAIHALPNITFLGGRVLDIPIRSTPTIAPAPTPAPATPLASIPRSHDPTIPSSTLRLLGLDWPEDLLALTLSIPPASIPRSQDPSIPATPPFPLALAHHPNTLIPASELGIPIVLAGHTHAGQIRLHPRLAPHTSSDLPPHLASGILQLRSTLCCISRGLGDGVIEGLRINCPRQIPLYTLRRAEPCAESEVVTQRAAW